MINEERTFEEFGYVSGDLSRGSHKKVWRICERCGKEEEVTYYSYINSTKLCKRCSSSHTMRINRGPFNIEYFQSVQNSIVDGYINEIKTFTEFKYYSIDLSSMSGREVWRICIGCGKANKAHYYNCTNGRAQCKSCASKGRTYSDETKKKLSFAWLIRGPFNIEYFQRIQMSIINGGINELKTFEEFKYYSIDLSHGSDRQIYRLCRNCMKEDVVAYKTYVNGCNICQSCSHIGKTRSEDTRKKISISNKGRICSEDIRKKISKTKIGTICSEDTRKKYLMLILVDDILWKVK